MAASTTWEKPHSDPNIASTSEIIIVSWSGPADPSNPLNWPQSRKWFTTILTSFGGLVTLMSGAMLAPALSAIGHDLQISVEETSMALSIYILAFAFGPMVLAPCSEVFGRRPIWIFGSAWYVVWNTACGISRSKSLLIIGRLMSGLGASAEFAVSGSIAADCWSADERGKSMAIGAFIPLLGPALGPIIGGVMVDALNWRWTFYALSIFEAVVVLLFIIGLPETHAQTLLSRKAAILRATTGERFYAQDELTCPTVVERLQSGLLRPTRLLCTQPALQLAAITSAYQFGLLYVVLSTFSELWTGRYKQSSTASGLHYIAIVIGYLIALQAGSWATDHIWRRLKERGAGIARPENRVPMMLPGAVLMPAGLLWYGWAAQRMVHWIMPDVGIAIFGCGYITSSYSVQAYVIEAFDGYTASAGAASRLLSSVFAFAFPIFAPALYSSLGYGYGNTILAGLAMALGVSAPWVLWTYGEKLRKMGRAIR